LVPCPFRRQRWQGEPLHQRIAAFVAPRAGGELFPVSSDSDFVRRVYLDFAGRIPSMAETRDFLAELAAGVEGA